jgi:flagellin-like hook-associated protein FlgL
MIERPPTPALRRARRVAFRRLALATSIVGIALPLVLALSGAADAQSDKATVIRGEIVEVHDRLPPAELLGVTHKHEFTFTLSGKNAVSETWANSYQKKDGSFQVMTTGANAVTLGDEHNEKVVWKVLGDRQLRRIGVGIQTINVTTITIDKDNHCKLDVRYLLQKGFTDIIAKREDNGQMAHFGLPHLVSAACTVE